MSKSDTPFLDGVCNALAIASLISARETSRRQKDRPTVRRTRTARQVYDTKRGQVVTLYTETETTTEKR